MSIITVLSDDSPRHPFRLTCTPRLRPLLLLLLVLAFATGISQVSSAVTILDPFTNAANWGPPIVGTNTRAIGLGGGHMNFTCSTAIDTNGAAIPRVANDLPGNTNVLLTTQDWSLQVDVHLDPTPLTSEGQFSDVFLGFGKTGGWFTNHVTFEFGHGRWSPYQNGYYIGDDITIDGEPAPELFSINNLNLPASEPSLRMDYSAANKSVTFYFDPDGPTGGYNWGVAKGSANLASGPYNLSLSATDTFTIFLLGSSAFQTVSTGEAYLSNLRIVVNQSPIVASGAATDVTDISATLTGAVNPNGLATTARFEYGLTTNYGSTAAVTLSPNNGVTTQVVSASLNGLTSGATYHYRLTSFNSGGSGITSDATFTLAAPLAYLYTTNSGAITITGYTGSNETIVIPSEIHGLPVTSIGYYAFGGCTSLTDVTIPHGVTNLAEGAFSRCTSLTSVAIPDGVEGIGGSAFEHCTSLTNVSIPASVTSIGDHQAFSDCPSLLAITVDPANAFYRSVDGILFNHNQTTLIQYPGGKPGSYTIPSSVTSIGEWAFERCIQLTAVTIPPGVTNLMPFYTCPSLTAINVDPLNSVYSSLDGILFNQDKTRLVEYPQGKPGSYTLPASVTSLRDGAFGGCTSLTAITVDATHSFFSSVAGVLFNKSQTTLIAYPGGKAGTHYTIPTSVSTVGIGAFYGCSRLTSVTIPSSATSIGESAFSNCTGLTSIAIPDSVTSLGIDAFSVCTSLTNVMIGNRLTSIGQNVFEDCTNLISLTIPASVASIGPDAFHRCTSLEAIYFQGNAPSIDLSAFNNDDHATLYYLPGTTGWDTWSGPPPAVLWNPLVQTSAASFGVGTTGFGFPITGTADIPIVVEATTNLTGAPWLALQSGTLTNGLIYFSDPDWTNFPARFYRIRSP